MYTKIFHPNLQAVGRSRARLYARGVALGWLVVLQTGVVMLGLRAHAWAAQGYNTTDKTITKAMAVAVTSSSTSGSQTTVTVEKSSVTHADKTLGVVVDPRADPVNVSSTGDEVYVATSGDAQVYVADINGAVKKGDLLAPSPIQGVLMKASSGTTGLLGVALQDMPTSQVQAVTVNESGGRQVSAKVGLVQMNMDVRLATGGQGDGTSVLQRIGQSIVRRPVSAAQAIVSLIILVLLITVEGGIVYAAVSSSMISLGRNPMAKKTIYRGIGQVTGLVAIVLVAGLSAIYVVMML